jgi:hypothetical protein
VLRLQTEILKDGKAKVDALTWFHRQWQLQQLQQDILLIFVT